MKIWLRTKEGPRRACKEPHSGAAYALVVGRCPRCKHGEPGLLGTIGAFGTTAVVFKVAGNGRRASADGGAYEADANCLACQTHVGLLRAEPTTILGVKEDEAVLTSKWKVC